MVMRSLLTAEICSLNPVSYYLLSTVLKQLKISKRAGNGPILIRMLHFEPLFLQWPKMKQFCKASTEMFSLKEVARVYKRIRQ